MNPLTSDTFSHHDHAMATDNSTVQLPSFYPDNSHFMMHSPGNFKQHYFGSAYQQGLDNAPLNQSSMTKRSVDGALGGPNMNIALGSHAAEYTLPSTSYTPHDSTTGIPIQHQAPPQRRRKKKSRRKKTTHAVAANVQGEETPASSRNPGYLMYVLILIGLIVGGVYLFQYGNDMNSTTKQWITVGLITLAISTTMYLLFDARHQATANANQYKSEEK